MKIQRSNKKKQISIALKQENQNTKTIATPNQKYLKIILLSSRLENSTLYDFHCKNSMKIKVPFGTAVKTLTEDGRATE